MIRNSSSPIKQMQYASKLKMIDKHLIRTDMGSNAVNLDYEQMLKVMALKLGIEPPQEILPFTAKTIIFDSFQTRSFIIRQQVAPKQNNFMLNVNTYVPIRLQVKINEKGPKFYRFQGNKAIQIYEQSFNEINVIATVQKTGIFSSVKFYLDLVQVQYNSPKKANVNMRPNINKELDQYIANNRGKSAEIIRNRSLTRSKQMMMRKTAVSFKPMKSIELVRSKSQYQNFQKKKSLYIKHVRKMSPAKDRILKESQQKYHLSKKEQMTQLSLIIYTAKLGMILYRTRLKQAAQKVKQMKINMLCMDFIKIIKNKFRLKMTQKARLRMNFHHTMQFLPTMMRNTAIKDAKNVLLQALTPFMNYRTIQQLGRNSQDYINSTIKIQRYAKMKLKQLRERVQFFIQILIKKEKIDVDRSKIKKIVEKYIVICRNKGKWTSKIYKFKEQLILLLRKNGLQ